MRRPARTSLDRIYENLDRIRELHAQGAQIRDIEQVQASLQIMATIAVAEALTEINETLGNSIYPALAERGS